jgi:hypothetical protein
MEKQHPIVTLTLLGSLIIGTMGAANASAGSVYYQGDMPPPSNASELETEASAEQAFQAAAARADAAMKRARTVDAEWPQTEKTLKQAMTAVAAGDYKTATQLVEAVRTQSEKGYNRALAKQEEEKARKAAAAKQQAKGEPQPKK